MICISLPVQQVPPFYSLPALSTNAVRVMFRGRLCETAQGAKPDRERERERNMVDTQPVLLDNKYFWWGCVREA